MWVWAREYECRLFGRSVAEMYSLRNLYPLIEDIYFYDQIAKQEKLSRSFFSSERNSLQLSFYFALRFDLQQKKINTPVDWLLCGMWMWTRLAA